MIPTLVTIHILLPGHLMDAPGLDVLPSQIHPESDDGWSFLQNEAHVYYSVTRKKVVELDDIQVDVLGMLTEEIAAFGGMIELKPYAQPYEHGPWLCEWLSEGDYDELDAGNMQALYEAAKGYLPKPGPVTDWLDEPVKPLKVETLVSVHFIGLWSYTMDSGFEGESPEINSIGFVGTGRVVPS